MRTIAKELTAYQRHVKNFAKTYTGKNLMKAAAKTWKKTPGSNTKKTQKSSPKTKRRGTNTGKKSKKGRGGTRLPGGIGFKAAIFGAAGLILAPRLIPIQSPGASKLAAGMAMRALKIGGGGPLAAVGIMELIAQYAAPMLLGGGLFGASGSGGTDF